MRSPHCARIDVLDVICLRAAQTLAVLGLLALIGFAFATCADGLLRSVANAPITAVGDIGPFIVAASVAACFPLAQLQRANITIEMFGAADGKALRLFSTLLVLVAIAAMTRQIFLYAMDDATNGDSTVMLAIPIAPFWFTAAALFACATVVQLAVVVREARA